MSETIPDEATKWRRLMGLAQPDQSGWFPDDLAHLWRHQLQAPLEDELGEGFPDDVTHDHDSSAHHTLAALLTHPSPPLKFLKLVKRLAKARRAQAEYPPEIATALYFVVIALALARHGDRVADLDNAALVRGLQWTIRMPWLDESTRSVMETALKMVLEA